MFLILFRFVDLKLRDLKEGSLRKSFFYGTQFEHKRAIKCPDWEWDDGKRECKKDMWILWEWEHKINKFIQYTSV